MSQEQRAIGRNTVRKTKKEILKRIHRTQVIKIAKAYGCTEYDMFGVSPGPDKSHPMYGLYRFKTGFGGELFHHLGCWDYPLDEDNYKLFQISEMGIQGYYRT